MSIRQAIASAIVATKGEADVNCIWVGLSGGVDSTVLLHALAQEAASTNLLSANTKIKALHVHHGLSSNADDWAKQAKNLCAQLSDQYDLVIDCIVEHVHLSRRSESLEQAARSARYQVFEKVCQKNDVLLQGHHLDDQIETFFMRALRGSGVTGLSGIPKQRSLSRTNTCQIVRPLLSFEKTQLIEYAKQHQLSWVEDESNQDSTIDRNWWRNKLLPKIWQRYPDKKQSLSRTINNIQHEQGLLQQLITEKIDSYNSVQSTELKIHPALNTIPRFDLHLIHNLDKPVALSYLRAWLAQHVDILPSAIQMQSIYVDMITARIDAEPSFNWADRALYRYQGYLFLWQGKDSLMAQNENERNWNGESQSFPLGLLSCEPEPKNSIGLKAASYAVRTWQAGDTAKPCGRSTRKMKKWWQDYNVPSWVRNHWPIIVDKDTNQIVAVPGLFICHGYQASDNQLVEGSWLLNWQFETQ